MKIHAVEAELFHAGGRTYRHDETNMHFSQICELVENSCLEFWKIVVSVLVDQVSKARGLMSLDLSTIFMIRDFMDTVNTRKAYILCILTAGSFS